MSLITNDTHSHKGISDTASPIQSRVARNKKLTFKDDDGNTHEHNVTQFVLEPDRCPIDQLLSADDFKLSRLIELGSNLQRIVAQPRDRFETIDSVMNALSNLQKHELAAEAAAAEPTPAAPTPAETTN